MQDSEIKIEYHFMYIKGFRDDVFTVAKLQRISSSPAKVRTARDAKASALERLVDIFRCGTESRNYLDFREVKKDPEVLGPLDAETEWAAYNDEILRVKGIRRLELFQLGVPAWTKEPPASRFRVKYRKGTMNDKPYLIAAVGSIMASPAAIWLTYPHARESALARLCDVFRIGTQGQIYKDLLDGGAEAGRTPEKVRVEWRACEAAVLREIEYETTPGLAPEEVKAEWDACQKEIERETKRAEVLSRRLESNRRRRSQ